MEKIVIFNLSRKLLMQRHVSPVFPFGAVGGRLLFTLVVIPKYPVGLRLLLSHGKVELVLKSKLPVKLLHGFRRMLPIILP